MKREEMYTYTTFCNDAITLAAGGEIADTQKFIDKANALKAVQDKKADYNATHTSASKAKGASAETKQRASQIFEILTDTPKTTEDINAELGTAYSALNVATAIKYLPNVTATKVVREKVNAKGLKGQKEYTAYFIASEETDAETDGADGETIE